MTLLTHKWLLTAFAMLAFAGNSILCRAALQDSAIDPASFTTIRLLAGAITLAVLVALRGNNIVKTGSWLSAWALFGYAAGFSFAYVQLSAATGALILFGTVQASMIGYALFRGERLQGWQLVGLSLALLGLLALLWPGLTAPPLVAAVLMMIAGISWAVYSINGKRQGAPLLATAGNFLRTLPITMVLSLVFIPDFAISNHGILYAILSGALTSGIGYAIWYAALPKLSGSEAATVQLSVPVIVAVGGVLLLSEPLLWREILASATIIGGVYLVIRRNTREPL